MRVLNSRKRTISKPAMAFAVMLSVVTAVSSIAIVSSQSRSDGKLQEQADNAALAGVNALAASDDKSDIQRIDASQSAVRNALSDSRLTIRDIASSPDNLTVQILVEVPSRGW